MGLDDPEESGDLDPRPASVGVCHVDGVWTRSAVGQRVSVGPGRPVCPELGTCLGDLHYGVDLQSGRLRTLPGDQDSCLTEEDPGWTELPRYPWVRQQSGVLVGSGGT